LRPGLPDGVDPFWADQSAQEQGGGARRSVTQAHLYGADDTVLGGLNAFYLLVDKPEVYGLPSNPKVPSRNVVQSAFWSIFTAIMTALGVLFAFRERRMTTGNTETRD
jgi:formate dehydrogenase iron-sulfur subunit